MQLFKVLSKIMIKGQEVKERANSPTFLRSTEKGSFSAGIYGCVFHSLSVWYKFAELFLPKPPA
jgi:hypothetical protein